MTKIKCNTTGIKFGDVLIIIILIITKLKKQKEFVRFAYQKKRRPYTHTLSHTTKIDHRNRNFQHLNTCCSQHSVSIMLSYSIAKY